MSKRIEILLVEDSPADVRLTQEALKDSDLDYRLSIVNDGEAAMEFLNTNKNTDLKPDLILLDLNMPKKNGHEVLAELNQIPSLSHIPVILLTVSQDQDDILKALKLKMNYYLCKPITTDKLAVLINAIHSLQFDQAFSKQPASADDAHIRYVMAGNPHTSADVLKRLAAEANVSIRRKVAENPNTPSESLIVLSTDSQSEVRSAVSENPHAPIAILETLAKDPDDDVRFHLASNPKVPLHILEVLSSDDNMYVMTSAKKTILSGK